MSKKPVNLPITDMVADIRAFHEKYQLVYTGKPRALQPDMGEFRRKFLNEELTEYRTASYKAEYYVAMLMQAPLGSLDDEEVGYCMSRVVEGLEGSLDALVDLVYVAIGTAYLQGFNFAEAWRRVHEANMKKVRVQRSEDSLRGSVYDVVKPKGWVPPSHTDLVSDHLHLTVMENKRLGLLCACNATRVPYGPPPGEVTIDGMVHGYDTCAEEQPK